MHYIIWISLFFILNSISITNEFGFNEYSKLDKLFSSLNSNNSNNSNPSEISIVLNPLIKLLNDTFYEILKNNNNNSKTHNNNTIKNDTDIHNNISELCANIFDNTFFSPNMTISKAYLQRFLNFTSITTNDISSYDECKKPTFKNLDINTSYIIIKYYKRIESRYSDQLLFYFPDNGIRGFCLPSGCSEEEYKNIILKLHEQRKEIMPISFELYNSSIYPTKLFDIGNHIYNIKNCQIFFNYFVLIVTLIQIFICFFPLSIFYLSYYFLKCFCCCCKKQTKRQAFKKKFLGFKKCYSISENSSILYSQNNNDEGLNFIKGIRGLNMFFYTIGMVFLITMHSPSKMDCPQVVRDMFTNPFYGIIFYSIKYAPIFLLSCSGASLSYKLLNYLDEKIRQEDVDTNEQRSNSIDDSLLSNGKKTEDYKGLNGGLFIRFISYQSGKYIIFILTLLFTIYSLYYFTSFFLDENPTWDYFKLILTEKIDFLKLISYFLLFPSFNFIHSKEQNYDPTSTVIFDYFWLVFNEMILFLIGIIIIYICIKKEYQILNFTYAISIFCILFKLVCYLIKINRLEDNKYYAPYILTYSYYGKIVINPLSNLGVYFIGICFGIYLFTFQKKINPNMAVNQGKEFLNKISFNLQYVLNAKKKNVYYIISYFLLMLILIFCIGEVFLNFDIVHVRDKDGTETYRSDEDKNKLYSISEIFNFFFIIENEVIVFLTLKSIFYLEIIMNSEFLSFLKSDFWGILNKIYFSYIIITVPIILFFVYHSNTKILVNFTNIIFYSYIIVFLSFAAGLIYKVLYEMPLKNLIRAFFRKKDKKNIRKKLEDNKNNDNRNLSFENE